MIDFIESLGLLDITLNFICNVVSRSSTQSAITEQTKEILKRFSPVFTSNLGRCTEAEAALALKSSTKSVFQPKRLVPYVDGELKRQEKMTVITPVTYSQWAVPIVVVKGIDDTIRLYADFSIGLNAALEDHQYPRQIREDIFTILNGSTCFAELDLTEAYLQVDVSAASRKLLTINTHRGLFQYTRLPIGVKTAPAIFQQIMDIMLTWIEGASAYLDDIIVVC